MKSFLVCVAVLCLASSSLGIKFPKDDPKVQEYGKECAKEIGIGMDFFEKMHKDGKPDLKVIETQESKCFIRCMLTKMELLKDDEFDVEKVKDTFEADDDVIEKGKLCVAENKQEDPCDRIYKIQRCIMAAIFKGKIPE